MAKPYQPGDAVEYFSGSMQTWIPARVLKRGDAVGTYDLDCKEAVEASRIRGTASVPATSSSAAPGPRNGTLPIREGDACFYKSSSLGWISAQMIKINPDGTFDLDVKQQVPACNVFAIEDGCAVEYHSTSSNSWIPARVLRRCRDPLTWDLDCKDAVHISKIRPPPNSTGGVAAQQQQQPQGAQRRSGVPGGLAPLPEDAAYRDSLETAQRQQKLAQLNAAVASANPEAIKRRLESTSALQLVGEQELDMAAHDLWKLETMPGARADLQRAIAKGNRIDLEAALEAGVAVGLPAAELDAGRQALHSLEVSPIWMYVPGDGNHMDLRKEPQVDGPRVRCRLAAGEYFCTSEERRGPDGILYLQLADGRGWAFDKKPGIGTLCKRSPIVEPDGPGIYVVIHDKTAITPTDSLGNDGDIVGKLAVGAVVNILEVVNKAGVRRIRGRLENPGGWISLLDSDSGKRWAVKRPQR